MPIVSQEIRRKTIQANGQIKVHEVFGDSLGREHRNFYVAPKGTTDQQLHDNLVVHIDTQNQFLKKLEIRKYLSDIENGLDVVGWSYAETDQAYRAEKLYEWVQQRIAEQNYQALKHIPGIIDQFSEAQLDSLLGVGKGAIIKSMTEKIRAMNAAVEGLEV